MEKRFLIDGQEIKLSINASDADIIKKSDNEYSLLFRNKNYNFKVLEEKGSHLTLELNYKKYAIEEIASIQNLLEKIGIADIQSQISDLEAPMPGLVINTKVKVGDLVEENDELLVLEAMKMENVLKSDGFGVVKSILVKKGEKVDKKQLLITFEVTD